MKIGMSIMPLEAFVLFNSYRHLCQHCSHRNL